MILSKVQRRIRCSLCNNLAEVGFGRRAADFMLCGKHIAEAVEDLKSMGMFVCECKCEKAEDVSEEQKEESSEEQKVVAEGDYTCKWCGEKFPKSEYTLNQFTTHSKACKKEHDGVPFSQ